MFHDPTNSKSTSVVGADADALPSDDDETLRRRSPTPAPSSSPLPLPPPPPSCSGESGSSGPPAALCRTVTVSGSSGVRKERRRWRSSSLPKSKYTDCS